MTYRLPAYAVPLLSGLKLEKLPCVAAMDSYRGLVPGSFFRLPGQALFYESKLAVDGDGSGGQQPGDVDYQDDTSLHDGAGHALNSLVYPFMVLPEPPWPTRPHAPGLEDFGVRLGDIGAAFWMKRWIGFVYGDIGPRGQIGEGSMCVAQQLGMNDSPAVGGISAEEIPPGVIHLVFPGTTDVVKGRTFRTVRQIQDEALARLTALGIDPRVPHPAATKAA